MESLKEITESINSKLEKDESGKITDDIAKILIYEKNNLEDIEKLKEENEKLKLEKENLLNVNGNLLQQIPQINEDEEDEKKDDKKPFDFKTIFKDGKFKR